MHLNKFLDEYRTNSQKNATQVLRCIRHGLLEKYNMDSPKTLTRTSRIRRLIWHKLTQECGGSFQQNSLRLLWRICNEFLEVFDTDSQKNPTKVQGHNLTQKFENFSEMFSIYVYGKKTLTISSHNSILRFHGIFKRKFWEISLGFAGKFNPKDLFKEFFWKFLQDSFIGYFEN